jgi:tetratricopeptide (TPR) repeat protein
MSQRSAIPGFAIEPTLRGAQLASEEEIQEALQAARSLLAAGARDQVLDIVERLAAVPLDRADWNDALGTLLTFCEAPARALRFFERAVELAPRTSAYRYNLATAQRMTGALAAAEANLDEVIAATPSDAHAYYTRADLRTQTAEHNHIAEMIAQLPEVTKDPRHEIMLCFALAKELEDVARYEESFAYLQRACSRQRRSMRYDVGEDVATMDRIVEVHNATALAAPRGEGGEECLFVLGLPRSGTTLVERILASHSRVHSAGESPAFPAETVKSVRRSAGRTVGKLEFAEQSLAIDPRSLGRAYLDAARPRAARGERFVDKQPLNYLYAGLIARALPDSRIVALAREPMDSCYAMYRILFASTCPFTYDLCDLGRYYVAWHRLMRHWQAVLGEQLFIVHYEDLVESQETVSRRLLAHCGLEWEPACLAFDQQPNAVTTASAVQVRQRMYTSSIGKWRHFERQLAPLSRILEAQSPAAGWRFDSAGGRLPPQLGHS